MVINDNEIILTRVPWNTVLENVYDFQNSFEQLGFFRTNGIVVTTNGREFRFNQRSIDINVSVDIAATYNYLVIVTSYANLCFFVSSPEYVSPNVTRLTIEPDYISSYMWRATVNQSFLNIGHVDRVARVDDTTLSAIYGNMVEPENVEVGSEYCYTSAGLLGPPSGGSISGFPVGTTFFYIISTDKVKTGDTIAPSFRIGKMLQPFALYMIPYHPTIQFYYRSNDQDVGVVSITELYNFAVTSFIQGVVGIYAAAYCTSTLTYGAYNSTGRGYTFSLQSVAGTTDEVEILPNIFENKSMINIVAMPATMKIQDIYRQKSTFTTSEWVGFSERERELKLGVYPFSFRQLTLQRGFSFDIWPQLSGDKMPLNYYIALGANFKEGYTLKNYGATNETVGYDDDEFARMRVNQTLNSYPVITNEYATYMRNNESSLITGLAADSALGVLNTVGTAAILAPFNPFAAVASVVAGAGNTAFNLLKTVSKLEDLKQVPDTVKQPGNNVVFEINAQGTGITIKDVSIPPPFMDKLANHFQRFGYTINRTMDIDRSTRYSFNFIKTVGANVTGECPKEALDQWREKLDAGITFWHRHNGAEMYSYNAPNYEVNAL